MKQIIQIFATAIIFIGSFSSCKKNASTPSTRPNQIFKLKTLLFLSYYGQPSGQPFDSSFSTYTYDAQNRISTIATRDWNDTSGSPIISTYLISTSYSQGLVNYAGYLNGSLSPTFQTIYYLHYPSSRIDSAIHQYNTGNAWLIFEKEHYTYNPDSSASTADTTFYDFSTNTVTNTSHAVFTWSGGNLIVLSTQNSNGTTELVNTDYYNNAIALAVGSLNGPGFVEGINLTTDYPKSRTILVDGNDFQQWAFTTKLDNNNRLTSTQWTLNQVNFSAPLYYLSTYTYY